MGDYAGYVNAFASALLGCNGRDSLGSGETLSLLMHWCGLQLV